jgi:hypothetical protein
MAGVGVSPALSLVLTVLWGGVVAADVDSVQRGVVRPIGAWKAVEFLRIVFLRGSARIAVFGG